ncbi:RICIN domain-containing protein [Streptomyces sp. NPDC005866]
MIKHMGRGLTGIALTALPLLVTAPAGHAAVPAAPAPEAFKITTQLNGKCLAANGDNVEVQACSARPVGNQLWYWEDKKLVNRAESHCLDVRNGELNAPAQLVGDCHGLADQRWVKDGGWLRTDVSNQCLSIQNNGDQREHAGINLRDCGSNTWQWWTLPNP